ncbi:hypothetical protein ABZ557_15010 [Streptomyces sp. NPDC019645]|uniref:hypothetical protein n=1 Tax=Streptomyces sp. NPDC019645 TaxID=3154786 RepID=UPI0033D521A3
MEQLGEQVAEEDNGGDRLAGAAGSGKSTAMAACTVAAAKANVRLASITTQWWCSLPMSTQPAPQRHMGTTCRET